MGLILKYVIIIKTENMFLDLFSFGSASLLLLTLFPDEAAGLSDEVLLIQTPVVEGCCPACLRGFCPSAPDSNE